MPFKKTSIEGLMEFTPRVFRDERGYFFESHNEKLFEQEGIKTHFVQDNQSKSTKGVLRGLHYQCGEYAQAKLVRVVQGRVQDVAVDLRPESPTYGRHHSVILDAEKHNQFYIPRGFAHGFLVLSETAIFCYKCDNFYDKASEGGILCTDPQLNIAWELPPSELILSEKDRNQPVFGQHRPIFQ